MNEVELKPNERIEPLDDGRYIIQSTDGYRFGADAVNLAKFALRFLRDGMNVFDLCSGCGIIGILIGMQKNCVVRGAELNAELFDMSVRSCALNGLDNIEFFNTDVRGDAECFKPSAYDIVVCNPPFYKADSISRSTAPTANSELTVTLDDVVRTASHILRVGGAFMIVHTTSRLDEVICACRDNGLTPKELILNRNCKTFMLRAVRGGKQGLTVSINSDRGE